MLSSGVWTTLLFSLQGSLTGQPVWGCFLSLPLTVDSVLFLPFRGAQDSRTTAMILTDRCWLEDRPSPGFESVPCQLMIAGHLEQHLSWGLGSFAIGQNGADRALGLPRKTSAEGLCSKDQRKKASSVPWTSSGILKARTPGFLYVRCPDLWGTQTQCLSFPAREMGLRELGWGGGVECVLLGCLVGVQE